jgi:hypothetical protein
LAETVVKMKEHYTNIEIIQQKKVFLQDKSALLKHEFDMLTDALKTQK